MKKILFVATLVASVSLVGAAANAQQRLRDGAVGAVGGALVGGPVGAVAGGVVGYTAGPHITHALSPHRHYRHRRHYR